MSDWLIVAGIPAILLAFYPLVIGLAQLKQLRNNPQWLTLLHLISWGMTLLLFGCSIIWRVSLRGQWLDVLPFGLGWLAAGSYFWLARKQLSRRAKLYFGSWFCYPACLALAYLADKIFFALVSIPILAFLPTTTYYSSPALTLRAPVSGFLAAKRIQLLTPVGFVLEKYGGFTSDDLLTSANDSIISAKMQTSWRPDSVGVLITTRQGQRLVMFSR